MNDTRTGAWTRVIVLAFVALSLALLTGCGDDAPPEPASEQRSTALANLEAAESAIETTAPDAKLLVVQTPSASAAGGNPLWVYTFGSPETGQMFTVSLANGTVMNTAPAGAAPLEAEEWASVPETAAWEIDSDEAYEAALEVADFESTPTGYSMVLETYVPRSAPAEPAVSAFVWYVSFRTGDGEELPTVVAVDARTGEATLVQE